MDTEKNTTLVVPGIYKRNDKTFFIVCSVLGTRHYCSKDRLDKLAKKTGSLENVGKTYVSREAKQAVKQEDAPKTDSKKARRARRSAGLTSDEAPRYTKLPDPPSDLWVPTHKTATLAKVTPILSNNGEKCLRPDIWEKNDSFCNGCEYFRFCTNKFKEWKSYNEQVGRDVDQTFVKIPHIYNG